MVYTVRPVLVHLLRKISKKPPISRQQRLSGEPGFLSLAVKRCSSLAYPGYQRRRRGKPNLQYHPEVSRTSIDLQQKQGKGTVPLSPGRGGVSRGLARSLKSPGICAATPDQTPLARGSPPPPAQGRRGQRPPPPRPEIRAGGAVRPARAAPNLPKTCGLAEARWGAAAPGVAFMGQENRDTPTGKQGARRDLESCREPSEPSGGWAAAPTSAAQPVSSRCHLPEGSTFPWDGNFLDSLAGFGVGDRLLRPKTPFEAPGWRRDNCLLNAPDLLTCVNYRN